MIETITNRLGMVRTLEKIDGTRIRVMGESNIDKIKTSKTNQVVAYNFESGPNYQVNGKVQFGGISWSITNITPIQNTHDDLSECILTVKPDY